MSKAKFDIVVHKRDAKTGRVTSVNPYTLRIHNAVEYFERPKGSGNLWFKNNEPAGRYEAGRFLVGASAAEHKEWVAPLSELDKIAQATASMQAENAKLQAELNEIKREAKFKTEGPEDKKAAPSEKLNQVIKKVEAKAAAQKQENA